MTRPGPETVDLWRVWQGLLVIVECLETGRWLGRVERAWQGDRKESQDRARH